jgi:hypothetical protein
VRAYFRVAPRFGVSMPWYLAIVVYTMWITAALIYWMCLVAFVAVVYAGRAGDRGWAAWQARRHPPA